MGVKYMVGGDMLEKRLHKKENDFEPVQSVTDHRISSNDILQSYILRIIEPNRNRELGSKLPNLIHTYVQ